MKYAPGVAAVLVFVIIGAVIGGWAGALVAAIIFVPLRWVETRGRDSLTEED